MLSNEVTYKNSQDRSQRSLSYYYHRQIHRVMNPARIIITVAEGKVIWVNMFWYVYDFNTKQHLTAGGCDRNGFRVWDVYNVVRTSKGSKEMVRRESCL